jgi:hypothetical protein
MGISLYHAAVFLFLTQEGMVVPPHTEAPMQRRLLQSAEAQTRKGGPVFPITGDLPVQIFRVLKIQSVDRLIQKEQLRLQFRAKPTIRNAFFRLPVDKSAGMRGGPFGAAENICTDMEMCDMLCVSDRAYRKRRKEGKNL